MAYVLLTAVQLPRKKGQGNEVVIALQGDQALQQLMLDDQGHDARMDFTAAAYQALAKNVKSAECLHSV